jgi:hypothetical protein
MTVASPKADLKFSYCECGCHGSAAGTGDLSYWIYNDLKGAFYALRGHGFTFGIPLDKFSKFGSFCEAREACNEDAVAQIERVLKACGVTT